MRATANARSRRAPPSPCPVRRPPASPRVPYRMRVMLSAMRTTWSSAPVDKHLRRCGACRSVITPSCVRMSTDAVAAVPYVRARARARSLAVRGVQQERVHERGGGVDRRWDAAAVLPCAHTGHAPPLTLRLGRIQVGAHLRPSRGRAHVSQRRERQRSCCAICATGSERVRAFTSLLISLVRAHLIVVAGAAAFTATLHSAVRFVLCLSRSHSAAQLTAQLSSDSLLLKLSSDSLLLTAQLNALCARSLTWRHSATSRHSVARSDAAIFVSNPNSAASSRWPRWGRGCCGCWAARCWRMRRTRSSNVRARRRDASGERPRR